MTRASDACERLARTRGELRLAIRAGRGPLREEAGSSDTGWTGRLWGRLKAIAGTHPLVQGADAWAERSPLAAVALMALDALNATLRPTAQRHPWRLVVGAVVAGGALAWSRPWRHLVSPALLAAVLPQLLGGLFGGASRPTWMRLAGALLNRTRGAHPV